MKMYKNIVTITKEQIENLGITAKDKYDWVDYTLRNKSKYVLPTKTRMVLNESDYFNVMPCALPSENVLGLKVVTRNETRRDRGLPNIEGDILLYSYDDFLPLALIDGAYITTMRTAAVAVHSLMNFAKKRDVIAMVGLGNIGIEIGKILFDLLGGEILQQLSCIATRIMQKSLLIDSRTIVILHSNSAILMKSS